MDGGYAKFARKFLDSDEWLSEVFTQGQAWADLFLRANWARGEVMIQGEKFILDRGQLAASTRYLATRWGWSVGRTRRYLDRLILERQVERQVERNKE